MCINSQYHFKLDRRHGRICISLEACSVGKDFSLLVTGGTAHVGAIALATPAGETKMAQLRGHRDGEVAVTIADIVAKALNCHVSVGCGIHYDCITPGEIATVRHLSQKLAQAFIHAARGTGNWSKGSC